MENSNLFLSDSGGENDFNEKQMNSVDEQFSEVEEEDISAKFLAQNKDLASLAAPMSFEALQSSLQDRDTDMEFRILTKITETTKHSDKIVDYCCENGNQDRYSTAVPCKPPIDPVAFNQVHLLEVDAKKHLNVNLYINASFISVSAPVKKRPDQNKEKYFIATQAPLESTMLSFWKMIWINGIDVIYFVTKIVEHGSPVANVYWKFPSKETLQEFTVSKVSKKDLGFCIVRELEVTNCALKETRTVTQYQVGQSLRGGGLGRQHRASRGSRQFRAPRSPAELRGVF
jgi:protein tyrosine phosphatase